MEYGSLNHLMQNEDSLIRAIIGHAEAQKNKSNESDIEKTSSSTSDIDKKGKYKHKFYGK